MKNNLELIEEEEEEDYQCKKFNKFRIRKRFSFFPWIVVRGFKSDYHWTGKWFSFVNIKEQKIEERYAYFDDGWTYKSFWTKWKEGWIFIEIKNIKIEYSKEDLKKAFEDGNLYGDDELELNTAGKETAFECWFEDIFKKK